MHIQKWTICLCIALKNLTRCHFHHHEFPYTSRSTCIYMYMYVDTQMYVCEYTTNTLCTCTVQCTCSHISSNNKTCLHFLPCLYTSSIVRVFLTDKSGQNWPQMLWGFDFHQIYSCRVCLDWHWWLPPEGSTRGEEARDPYSASLTQHIQVYSIKHNFRLTYTSPFLHITWHALQYFSHITWHALHYFPHMTWHVLYTYSVLYTCTFVYIIHLCTSPAMQYMYITLATPLLREVSSFWTRICTKPATMNASPAMNIPTTIRCRGL